jgi:regulator of cell morphogenesis and NO signaling
MARGREKKGKRMTDLNLRTTVGEWVAKHPHSSRIFEAMKIDYCCGGGKSLEQACSDRQLDPSAVLSRLQAIVEEGTLERSQDWTRASLGDLCDHIEQLHHAYLRTVLPHLTDLIAKVVNAHGTHHRELAELQQVFTGLRAELEPHMFKEERILFPAIRQLEQSSTRPMFPFGTLDNPIRMMEHEHDNAGNALEQIRLLTKDFQPPEDACHSYRAMLDELSDLESNMHQHVHKENNILFPRARALEGETAILSKG